ncbi:MAG TPA: endo-1,4-beta-xylanase [Stellaceae bacterium]|nr:endo-1,4-beta-xylanase [Stellaceae bacterium]
MRKGNILPVLTRRSAMAGAVAALLRPGSRPAAAAAPPALRDLAAAKGILYGCCVQEAQLAARDDFTALVLRECSAIVPENEMKWQWMSRRPDEEDFSIPDRIVDFAARHRLALRGHTLLWYWRTPDWFKALPRGPGAEGAMVRRVTEMCRRYRGRVFCWDVVNEPIDVGHGRADDLRKTVFLDEVGPDYLDLAYRAAREADPGASLVVNEYGIVHDTPEADGKRAAVLRLLERTKRRGTPVDALGVQAHLDVGGDPFSPVKFRRFLADVAALGLGIQVTELDVTDARAPAEIAPRDRLVADAYARFLDAALDEPSVGVVVTWGLSDRHSWIVRHESNDQGWRKDGLSSRPLPFDAALARKPAWDALAAAFRAAPARPAGKWAAPG